MKTEYLFPNQESENNRIQKSWKVIEEIIKKVEDLSKMKHEEKRGSIIELTDSEEQKYTISSVTDKNPEDNKKVAEEIHEFWGNFFEKNEIQEAKYNQKAIEEHLSDFYLIRNNEQDIVGAMNTAFIESPAAENPKQSETSLLIWYVATLDSERGKGLGAELYKKALTDFLEKTKEKNAIAKGVIGETVPDVEPFLNKMDRKRVYYENKDGALIEVPFEAPSEIEDQDDEPVAEHFMVIMLDKEKEEDGKISTDTLLSFIRSVYDQYCLPEWFEDKSTCEKAVRDSNAIYKRTEATLASAVGGKIILLSSSERKKLIASGKKIIEISDDES